MDTEEAKKNLEKIVKAYRESGWIVEGKTGGPEKIAVEMLKKLQAGTEKYRGYYVSGDHYTRESCGEHFEFHKKVDDYDKVRIDLHLRQRLERGKNQEEIISVYFASSEVTSLSMCKDIPSKLALMITGQTYGRLAGDSYPFDTSDETDKLLKIREKIESIIKKLKK